MGFDSPSIIRYLEPSTGNLLKAKFANCRFIEHVFATAHQPNSDTPLNYVAPKTFNMNPDPPTSLTNTETIKLLKIKALAENTHDGFSTEDRIIRNAVSGTGMTLRAKRATP